MNAFVADLPSLARGLATTFTISALSMLAAVALGFLVGVARSRAPRAIDLPLLAIVDFFRGIPLLVLMYFLFFGLPQLGVRTSGNVAAIAALSLYAGALGSEIVRGAIVSIPRGQTEAAYALGLGTLATLRLVVVPQALARMLPPFVALFATIVESSSLSALIGVDDLLQSVKSHVEANSDLKLPLYSLALAAYFAINFPVSLASRTLARKVAAT